MIYYSYEGIAKEEFWQQVPDSHREYVEMLHGVSLRTSLYNRKTAGRVFCFVESISDGLVSMGILSADRVCVKEDADAFLDALGIHLRDGCFKEITTGDALNRLRASCRNDYIDDDDDVIEMFNLELLTGRMRRSIDFGEALIEEKQKPELYRDAGELLVCDPILAELDRIFEGSAMPSVFGHPVHYMIETDDPDARRGMCLLLIEALYANNRLRSRRYSVLDLFPESDLSVAGLNRLYEAASGGTVVLRFMPGDDAENEQASPSRRIIGALCKAMKRHRGKVLTVFCLPRECTKTRDIFMDYLTDVTLVELTEDHVYGETAVKYLKRLARENKIRTDSRLLNTVEPDKGYLAPDLRMLFDRWYDAKLKSAVFPQYRSMTAVSEKVRVEPPKGSAYSELMEMIGLTEAKRVINQALNYFKAMKLFGEKGMKQERPAMHMVFTGNPGTAKTSVARLFAGIMRENNLLSRGELIEVGRGDLVGKFVGWTAPTIKKKFLEARGSVLFIDEAYSLVDDRDGSYGDEAINTIVQEMENHRDDVVVIFAGYPDKMEKFLQKNPGLSSRIAFHVPFADYNEEELCEIASLFAKKKGLRLTEGALDRLYDVFAAARTQKDFGNGRYVRNVIEKAKMAQAGRLLEMDPGDVGPEEIAAILPEDIILPEAKPVVLRQKIGFAACG